MPERTEALLLDWDGTVVTFDRRAAFAHALPNANDEAHRAARLDALDRLDRARALAGDYGRREVFAAETDDPDAAEARFWDGIIAHARPTAGAMTLLEHCRAQRIPLGLVTDTDGARGRKLDRLRASGLLGYFDTIAIAGETVDAAKPAPDAFVHALHALGAAPQRSVMVGDKVHADLRPAAGLGMHAIWLRGEYPGEWAPVVDRLDDVIPLL